MDKYRYEFTIAVFSLIWRNVENVLKTVCFAEL